MMRVMYSSFLGLVVFVLSHSLASAQQLTITIDGPTTSNLNETKVYYVEFRDQYGPITTPLFGTGWWSVGGGNVISSSTDQAHIQWTSAGGGQIFYEFEDPFNYYYTSLVVQVSSLGPLTPQTTFTFERFCGSTKVTRNTSPTVSGEQWFWQTSSTGTSTALGSANNITVSSGPLYLRARSGTGVWSSGTQQVNGLTFITTPPATPASATHGHAIKNGAVAIPLSVSSVSGANSYRWYTTSGSLVTATTSPSYTPTVSATTTYHVASVISSCESTTRTPVTANVYPEPIIAATNGARLANGSTVTLSISNSTYDEYNWFKLGETSFTTGPSFEVTEEGLYTVRVKKGNSQYFTHPVGIQVWGGLNGQNVNYIVSNTIQIPNVTDLAMIESLPIGSKLQTVQYFDGLGRPIQNVTTQGSPQRLDIVQPIVYDAFGRESEKYLPYSGGNDGWFKTDFKPHGHPEYFNAQSSPQFKFYQSTAAVATDTRPFSSVEFEASPLSRPLKEYGPGAAWAATEGANRYIGYGYKINVHGTGEGMERIVAWRVNGNGVLGRESAVTEFIQDGGYYATGQIWIKETSDEARHRVREYSDKQGRVILKKVQVVEPALVNNDSHWAQTYYIYDDFGNLVMVLPPEAVKALTE